MAKDIKMKDEALGVGKYYLVDIDKVLEIYKAAGYDVENDDEEVPTSLQVGDEDCFFTGDFIQRDGKYFEIVIAAEGFDWTEVENEEEGQIEDEHE